MKICYLLDFYGYVTVSSYYQRTQTTRGQKQHWIPDKSSEIYEIKDHDTSTSIKELTLKRMWLFDLDQAISRIDTFPYCCLCKKKKIWFSRCWSFYYELFRWHVKVSRKRHTKSRDKSNMDQLSTFLSSLHLFLHYIWFLTWR